MQKRLSQKSNEAKKDGNAIGFQLSKYTHFKKKNTSND